MAESAHHGRFILSYKYGKPSGLEARVFSPAATPARRAPRPEYDARYYAAFVRVPDGNKIEAAAFVAK